MAEASKRAADLKRNRTPQVALQLPAMGELEMAHPATPERGTLASTVESTKHGKLSQGMNSDEFGGKDGKGEETLEIHGGDSESDNRDIESEEDGVAEFEAEDSASDDEVEDDVDSISDDGDEKNSDSDSHDSESHDEAIITPQALPTVELLKSPATVQSIHTISKLSESTNYMRRFSSLDKYRAGSKMTAFS